MEQRFRGEKMFLAVRPYPTRRVQKGTPTQLKDHHIRFADSAAYSKHAFVKRPLNATCSALRLISTLSVVHVGGDLHLAA